MIDYHHFPRSMRMISCERIHVFIRMNTERTEILNILSFTSTDGTRQLPEDLDRYLRTVVHMDSGTKITTGIALTKAIFTLPLRYPDHPDCKEFVQAYLEMADRLKLTDLIDNDYFNRDIIASMAYRSDAKSLKAMLKNCPRQIITSTSYFQNLFQYDFTTVADTDLQQFAHLTQPVADLVLLPWQDVYRKQIPSPLEMPNFPKVWNRSNSVSRIDFGKPRVELNEASDKLPLPQKTDNFTELLKEVQCAPELWSAFK